LGQRTGNKHQISRGVLDTYTVDIQSQTCSCQGWSLSGIPCAYACATILELQHNPKDYVSEYYKKVTQLRIYSHLINPCKNTNQWNHLLSEAYLVDLQKREEDLHMRNTLQRCARLGVKRSALSVKLWDTTQGDARTIT